MEHRHTVATEFSKDNGGIVASNLTYLKFESEYKHEGKKAESEVKSEQFEKVDNS